jgi:bleomycin hydrolase
MLILIGVTFFGQISAQEITFENESLMLKKQEIVKATPVKDQGKTGTCWAFSTLSFIESELMRMERGEYDLSEMYLVRNIYPEKAEKYVRMHGRANFTDGGLAHDVMTTISEYGIVPEEIYMGRVSEEEKHNHHELQAVLDGMLNGLIGNKEPLSKVWLNAYDGVLDAYLGKRPEEFKYNNKTYTPQTFVEKVLGFNPDDYIELTSFSDRPFYQQVMLEIPDNWSNGLYYNLPIDEMIKVMENALENGYSIVWDGDISEREFNFSKGVATVPLKDWKNKTLDEKRNTGTVYEPEMEITQEMRQEAFITQTTTDDHLMHIIGLVQDDNKTKYYLTKNSWGRSNKLGGYIYMSEAYIMLKSVAIMVHKDALPNKTAKKLGL